MISFDFLEFLMISCDFMEMISLESKGNMFERKIGEYGLANKTQNDDTFNLTEDF